ncbi:MAG: metalloregulator ArsR/SmtB family transcription factor [Agarilytica sp.]
MNQDIAFTALANSTRRQLLTLLLKGPCTAGDLATEFKLSRSAVSEHLGVLRRAQLVSDKQIGRTRRYEISGEAFQDINEWLEPFKNYWEKRMENLSDVLNEIPD